MKHTRLAAVIGTAITAAGLAAIAGCGATAKGPAAAAAHVGPLAQAYQGGSVSSD